ncbi:MAG TPA: SpoIIE family protein phosphatase [Holophagaceae bacterium]|nr:SpoIIE family protein phosphatase [Holophagaceae bacterium]
MSHTLRLHAPGRSPWTLEPERGEYTLGRSSDNDLVIEDLSLSRHHARFRWADGHWLVEDLHSKNGTSLNGQRLDSASPMGPGDELAPGNLRIQVKSSDETGPNVIIEARETGPWAPSLIMKAQELRAASAQAAEGARAVAALGFLETVALDLVREGETTEQLERLLEGLQHHMQADRGAFLVQGEDQAWDTVVSRGSERDGSAIHLPGTLVEASLQRGQAILMSDVESMKPELISASIVHSGIRSALVTPLEAEGNILGLLYLDAVNPTRHFDREDLRLATLIAHLAASRLRSARLEAEAQRHRDLEREMVHARRIQQGFLPAEPACVEGFEVLGYNAPAWRVSGDLYGSWVLEDGAFCAAVADVSGKGMGPGLLMVTFQAYMDAWADWSALPPVLLDRLSRALARHTEANRYITAFLIHMDPESGRLRYASAGHLPGLLRRRDGQVEVLQGEGLPLAMLPGQVPYEGGETVMEPGEVLLLYTDGLTEAESPEGEEYGMERLQELLGEIGGQPLPALKEALVGALSVHGRGSGAKDDQTFLVLRRKA